MNYGGYPEDGIKANANYGLSTNAMAQTHVCIDTSLTQKANQIKELAIGLRNISNEVVARTLNPTPESSSSFGDKAMMGGSLEGTLDEITQILEEAFRHVNRLNRQV